MFSRKNLRFQMVTLTVIILLIPVFFIMYDIHYAGKKEEITFIAKEERLGTLVRTVHNDMQANMFADGQTTSNFTSEELNIYMKKIFSDVAGPLAELNPGVRLSLYMPEGNDLIVEGFLREYRQLSPAGQKEREKRIFNESFIGIQSVLASGQPLATISGERADRFFANFVPVRLNDKTVAVLWADERLHPIFTQAQKFRTLTRYCSLVAIFIGAVGVFAIINKLTKDVRKIKRGLENLEKDINNHLPDMPGEMGEIAEAINNMARSVAEKERLEVEIRRQERLASLGQVVTGVAHELRNPIGIIKTSVQVMEREITDAAVQEYCQVIKQQVDRQNKVITELLTYGRPSKPVLEFYEINKLLDSVLTFTSAQLRQNKINLVTNFDDRLPPVFVDGERIKQVFVNLILNAIEAMPGGGTLQISSQIHRDNISILFKDTGCGIQHLEDLTKVFEPFFTTKDAGTGLGLTICKQIISMHNGELSVKSNVDGGTTFIIEIPFINDGGWAPVDP